MPRDMIANRYWSKSGGIILIVGVFFFSLLPVLAQVSTYHSDEHYYTDAAVYMAQHGDYLTPHYSDGALRTKKPIITYWVLIAGYALLGINFFAARLPFLITGAATVWLTYMFARQLFQHRRIAILSAAILASNMQFVMLSLRATPDILQTFFMLVSLYGFGALVFHRDYRLRNLLLTYFGAAMAVLTKGLLGAVLIGFMALYLVFSREKASTLKRILHWPLITSAVAVALSWYAYIYYQHGAEALLRFYSDQVAGKVDSSKFYILLNIKEYIWGVFRNFIPWSLLILVGYVARRNSVNVLVRDHRKPIAFILGWFVLLLAIFSGSTDCRTRYLVPAYPLLCIFIAAIFWEIIENNGIRRMWFWCCGFFLFLFAGAGIILVWVGFVINWQVAIGGVILICAAAWGIGGVFASKQSPGPVVFGMVLLIAVAALRGFVLPTFEFSPSKSMAACLLPEVEAGRITSIWSGRRANHLRQLYTITQGRLRVNYYPRGKIPSNLEPSAAFVVSNQDRKAFDTQAYTLHQCGSVFRDPALSDVWQGLLTGDKAVVIAAIQEPIYLARPKI